MSEFVIVRYFTNTFTNKRVICRRRKDGEGIIGKRKVSLREKKTWVREREVGWETM